MLPQCGVQSEQRARPSVLSIQDRMHTTLNRQYPCEMIQPRSEDFEDSLLDTMYSSRSSLQICGASKGSFTPYCRSDSYPINLASQILKFHTHKTAETEEMNVERRRGEANRCNERLSEDLDIFIRPVCSISKTLSDVMASEDKFVSSL